MPCSVCKQHGHNKRTCEQQKPEAKTEKKQKEKKQKEKKQKEKKQKEKKQKHKKKACNKEQNKEQAEQKEEEQLKSHEDCAICLCNCSKDTKCCQLECGHVFHTSCIFTWFEKHDTCPMCRMQVKQMKKRERKVRLPSVNIVAAMERMVVETYMMIKMRLESLSYNEYENLLQIDEDDPDDL